MLPNVQHNIELIFDGGTRLTNPGLGYGSYKISINGASYIETHWEGTEIITNNLAEYITLDLALVELLASSIHNNLLIYGDSNLVRNQVGTYNMESGKWSGWKCNHSQFVPYLLNIRGNLLQFPTWYFKYKPKKEIVKILGH